MTRLLDMLKPKPKAVGMRSYLMARWRRLQGLGQYRFPGRVHRKKKKDQRGWMPGRLRLGGLQAPRRVTDPVNRIYNEIIKRRRKQGTYPSPFLWAKRKCWRQP